MGAFRYLELAQFNVRSGGRAEVKEKLPTLKIKVKLGVGSLKEVHRGGMGVEGHTPSIPYPLVVTFRDQ